MTIIGALEDTDTGTEIERNDSSAPISTIESEPSAASVNCQYLGETLGETLIICYLWLSAGAWIASGEEFWCERRA